MPKVHCNHCPIIEFYNTNPIMVDRPTGKCKEGKPVTVKRRLCPILIAVSQAFKMPMGKLKK